MLTNRLDQVDDGKANAPVTQVLVDLDLGELAIEMIRTVKAHTPTIPVLAFGPHVAVDLLKAADEAGADQVLPRGAFTAQLPQLLVRA